MQKYYYSPTGILLSRIYKLWLIFIILTSMFSCSKKNSNTAATSPPAAPPVITTKNFEVKESQILDSAGNEFIAKGVDVNGPLWPWTRPTIPDISLIADVWKCNLVRVNCWPQNTPYPNTNNIDLDGIVKGFTDKKVVVMIEDQSFTGTYPTSAELATAIDWWKALANKYKGNSYVWFNVMNEPGNAGSAVASTWLDVHDAVIKAIRATGANNIIVCDEQGYGQANGFDKTSSSAALTYGEALTAKYKNIVFSLHTYEYWIYGQARLQNYIDAIKAEKLALLIGEYGVGNNYSMEVASSIFKVCIPNKIGRIAWHWVGIDVFKLVTTGSGGGFDIDNTSGAKPTNLSFGGNLVWLDNHDQLQPNDLALVPPAVIVANADFESGDNPTNGSNQIAEWINFGTAVLDNIPGNVKQGTFSLKINDGTAGGCGQNIYLQPGATYKITAWGKNSSVAVAPSTIGLKYTTTYNGPETALANLDFMENNFIEKSVTFTTPAQITSMFLFIYKNDTAPAFWCDNIRIEKQ